MHSLTISHPPHPNAPTTPRSKFLKRDFESLLRGNFFFIKKCFCTKKNFPKWHFTTHTWRLCLTKFAKQCFKALYECSTRSALHVLSKKLFVKHRPLYDPSQSFDEGTKPVCSPLRDAYSVRLPLFPIALISKMRRSSEGSMLSELPNQCVCDHSDGVV